jgi:RNA-dependent RNA polymerase
MDRLLTLGNDCAEEIACMKENINLLIDIYYDALDAPKKGGRKVSFPTLLAVKCTLTKVFLFLRNWMK